MKLSVITINWNNLEGLKGTVESVINQTFDDFEYIVIDGGSTDGSAEYLEQNKDHFAYCVSEPDKGVYNAMNKGVAKAKGEYCLFINSGDELFSPDTLKILFCKTQGFDTDYIYGNVAYTLHKKIRGYTKTPKKISGYFLYKGTLPHPSLFTKTYILRKNKYSEDYKIISDWAQMFDGIVLKGYTTLHVDHVISKYDLSGISSNNSELIYKERKDFFNSKLSEAQMLDYRKICEGDSLLEQILNRLRSKSIAYKLITAVAIIIFLPITISRRLNMNIKKHL